MPRCKYHRTKFVQKFFNQKYCLSDTDCIKAFNEFVKAETKRKEAKKWTAEKKVIKESLKSHKDYLKELQTVFNTFIRMRDKDRPCVSCGCNMAERKGDASHFYSVGSTPALRFNEDNVHLACVPCNQFAHGNLLEYAERLPGRIGQSRFELLKSKKNDVTKYSIPELKAKIIHYKSQVKILSERK